MSMQNSNMRCLVEACKQLGIAYTAQDAIGNWITVHLDSDLHFVRSKTPFNSSSMDTIFRDKEYCYMLLRKEIQTPQTVGYLDPRVEEQWQPLVTFKTVDAIRDDIVQRFGLPVIVKRNSGAQGDNVFMATTPEEVSKALESIFNKHTTSYDSVAIAQPYVAISREYRVLWFRGQMMLVYEKVTTQGKPVSLSPLANPGSLTRIIPLDDPISVQIRAFLETSPTIRSFEYCGFDVAIDTSDTLWVIEVNGWPGTMKLTRDNGDEALVAVYKKILQQLQGKVV
jgi:glutathione synthase/RimK-type ligase-like ATP-grasp enzyme